MSNDDRGLVASLYTRVLSSGGSPDLVADGERILAEGWQSIGGYAGPSKNRSAFLNQVKGFMLLIPDLTWKVEEIVAAGDRFVVRSRATGTPRGVFKGVDPTGKKFEIMTIDMHTVKNGRIHETHHVEDWIGAIQQLKK